MAARIEGDHEIFEEALELLLAFRIGKVEVVALEVPSLEVVSPSLKPVGIHEIHAFDSGGATEVQISHLSAVISQPAERIRYGNKFALFDTTKTKPPYTAPPLSQSTLRCMVPVQSPTLVSCY